MQAIMRQLEQYGYSQVDHQGPTCTASGFRAQMYRIEDLRVGVAFKHVRISGLGFRCFSNSFEGLVTNAPASERSTWKPKLPTVMG